MKNKTDRMLDNLEKIIGVLGVSLFGMISYLFVNIDKLSFVKNVVLTLGIIELTLLIIGLGIAYNEHFNKLKD